MKHYVLLCTAAGLQSAAAVARQVPATPPESSSTTQASTPFAPDAATPEDKSLTVDKITVTAQRREQNLQRVSTANSAFSGEDLQRKVTPDSTYLRKFMASVVRFNNGNQLTIANYYFRGIGAADVFQTTDTPVTTYVGEVPLSRIVGPNLKFNDIERVEVLRGPKARYLGEIYSAERCPITRADQTITLSSIPNVVGALSAS